MSSLSENLKQLYPERYVYKYDKLYEILKSIGDTDNPSNIDIPITDVDAYLKYPQYRFIYNKMVICQFQNVLHAPFPIIPSKFPIISKPIINLYGMGLKIHKIENIEQFWKYWLSTKFWMEFLEGQHYSYDLAIYQGKISWFCCFQGYPLESIGSFDYWELIYPESLPPNVTQIVERYLKDYTGILNIECIGDYIIEAHLRLGDMDQLMEKEILQEVINLYRGQNWTLPMTFRPSKIFMFPLFYDNFNDFKLTEEQIRDACLNTICYQIDNDMGANPPGKMRVLNITSSDYQSGYLARLRVIKLNQRILQE